MFEVGNTNQPQSTPPPVPWGAVSGTPERGQEPTIPRWRDPLSETWPQAHHATVEGVLPEPSCLPGRLKASQGH